MSQADSNALDRLMQRPKPTVPPRTDEVSPPLMPQSKTQELQDSKTPTTPDVKTPLRQDLNTSIDPDTFETVRNTTRIEKSVERDLRHLCTENRLTKETWLEAAYLYLSQQPEAMETVIQLAKERLEERKRIADHRRAVSMQKRVIKF